MGHLLSPLASQIIHSEDLNKLTNLIESKKDYFKKAEKSVQSALETINFNLQWIEHNVQDLKSRLQNRLNFMDFIKHEDA